jgi:hypothetical protein
MQHISSDLSLMYNLMIKTKSSKYIAKYRLTPINNFDYLELRLTYNYTSFINIKPIQLITPIQNNDNIGFID